MCGCELCVAVGVCGGLSLCVSVQCVGNCDCERLCVSGCEEVRGSEVCEQMWLCDMCMPVC